MSNGRPTGRKEMRISIGVVLLALTASGSAWALANPASVFCAQSGGKTEIRNGVHGQYGVCRLPDRRGGGEWSYYPPMKSHTPPPYVPPLFPPPPHPRTP